MRLEWIKIECEHIRANQNRAALRDLIPFFFARDLINRIQISTYAESYSHLKTGLKGFWNFKMASLSNTNKYIEKVAISNKYNYCCFPSPNELMRKIELKIQVLKKACVTYLQNRICLYMCFQVDSSRHFFTLANIEFQVHKQLN